MNTFSKRKDQLRIRKKHYETQDQTYIFLKKFRVKRQDFYLFIYQFS